MTRIFAKLVLTGALAILVSPSVGVAGGRGGGPGGGGGGRGGMERGQMGRSPMGNSPSFSQPHSSINESRSQGNSAGFGNRPPTGGGESGSRSPFGNTEGAGGRSPNSGSSTAGAGTANRSQTSNPNAGATAGAGYANRNQTSNPNAGAAAAGAGYANRNQSGPSAAGAAAAGAGYENRNQGVNPSTAGAAAAGAGYANRNQNPYPNAGAAAAGAGYANRNQSPYPNAGAAAVGAGYANRNQYDQYHPGMTNGYWNGNYWATGAGAVGMSMRGVGAWGVGSPIYGYGYSGYSNPYASGAGAAQPVAGAQSSAAPAYDYSQPINTATAPSAPDATDQAASAFDKARDAFRSSDYATALQGVQQVLTQVPNDATLHEFLALVLFAQGKYEQAAAPLYAVLSVGPGWDWTTLIGNYSDAELYTNQCRGLEAFVKANPRSARARFVLAYHYICQGHADSAADQLKAVVAVQPNDTLSAQLLGKLQPTSPAPPAPPQAQPFDATKLTGTWTAQGSQNGKVTLAIKADGGFTWTVAPPGKTPMSIVGMSTVADGVLTLADQSSQVGALSGQVVWQDPTHFTFRATGAPADDPGLKFAR